MKTKKGLKLFLLSRESEKGQSLVLWTLFLVFVILPITALAIDQGSLYWARRERQKITDAACLNGAIAMRLGLDPYAAIVNTLNGHGLTAEYYSPQVGNGTSLDVGIEIAGESIRVAVWGPTQAWFSQFIPGWQGWSIGARPHCEKGIGGPAPLVLEEVVDDGDLVLETKKPNDHWEGGACPDQISEPNSDPSLRNPPYCWVWGVDQQVLAGDGHNANEGTVSMNGLVAPDVRCEGAPSVTNLCESKVYIPPAEEGAVNPLKGLTKEYMCGGYNGYEPIPGVFSGVHSANVAQMEGVSNAMLSKAIQQCYGLNELIVFWVYSGGVVWDGNKNYEYVEIIGLAVGRITYVDANTVAVIPVYPAQNLGDPNTLRDDLPKTVDELGEAGFNVRPILLPWD
jgi:hypothetical protein